MSFKTGTTKQYLIILIMFILSLICSSLTIAAEKNIKLEIEQEFDKDGWGWSEPAQFVIRNKNQWEEIWNTLYADNPTFLQYVPPPQYNPPPKLPDINFGRKMVIAVFLGPCATLIKVKITKIVKTKEKIIVSIKTTRTILQVLSNPYHMVVVEKSSLPVKFKFQKQ